MNREEFVNAFIECLKQNDSIRSYDETAEGTYAYFVESKIVDLKP